MGFYTVVSLIVIGVVLTWWVRLRRWLRRRTNQAVEAERCRCGYNLRGLTVLRCPECGRVVGFDATAEELTLTKEELERAHVVREQRRKAAVGGNQMTKPETGNPNEARNPESEV